MHLSESVFLANISRNIEKLEYRYTIQAYLLDEASVQKVRDSINEALSLRYVVDDTLNKRCASLEALSQLQQSLHTLRQFIDCKSYEECVNRLESTQSLLDTCASQGVDISGAQKSFMSLRHSVLKKFPKKKQNIKKNISVRVKTPVKEEILPQEDTSVVSQNTSEPVVTDPVPSSDEKASDPLVEEVTPAKEILLKPTVNKVKSFKLLTQLQDINVELSKILNKSTVDSSLTLLQSDGTKIWAKLLKYSRPDVQSVCNQFQNLLSQIEKRKSRNVSVSFFHP